MPEGLEAQGVAASIAFRDGGVRIVASSFTFPRPRSPFALRASDGKDSFTREVSYRIDDHKGNYIRWLADLKTTVDVGAPRAPGVRELDMVNITFAEKEARPDARSRDILQDLVGPNIEAVHMYTMVPGNVPRALTEQRESAVRTALRDWTDRYLYSSRSPIQQSGLPEGNGNLMRIGYIRKGSRG